MSVIFKEKDDKSDSIVSALPAGPGGRVLQVGPPAEKPRSEHK